jgi:hypothetical protein
MVRMLTDAIASHDPSVTSVVLVKQGFDEVATH